MADYEGSVVSMIKFSNKLRQLDLSKSSSEYNKQLQSEIHKLMYNLNAHGYAHSVAHVLHQDIQGASSGRAVALLRCAVTIVNRVKGGVWSSFEHWLPNTVEGIYERFCKNRDAVNKSQMVLLRNEWHHLFSYETLKDIDDRLRQLDGNWPLFTYQNSVEKPSVSSKVMCTRPPMLHKPITMARSPAQLSMLNCDVPSSPRLTSTSPAYLAAFNKPASPKVVAIKNSGKERAKVSPKAQFRPLEFIKPPSSRRSTTETKLRQSNVSSDKENSADFYNQLGFHQSLAYSSYGNY